MTNYVQLDDLLTPMGWPCSMAAADEPTPAADGLAELAAARDAAQAAARERGWQRDIAERERDDARRELADLREAHADRLRELLAQPRYVGEALHVLRERDQLRAQLNHALDVLDRIGTDAACAADHGAGE